MSKVEIEYEKQKERLRKLKAENVGLRQIEGRLPECVCFIQSMRAFKC